MLSFLGKSLLTTLFLMLLAFVFAFFYYSKQIAKPLSFSEDQIYSITPGQSVRHLSKRLYEDGIVNEPYSLQLLSRTKFRGQHIKAGDYQFSEGMTSIDVLEHVIAGKVVQFKVTILEGWTFQQFLQALAKSDNINHTLTGLSVPEVLSKLNFNEVNPEGWFYPDTYIYTRADTDVDVLNRAHQRMKEELSQAWQNRDIEKTKHLKSPYESLILASIIERETSLDDERRKVSSVFHNRLSKGMLLQTDPTIIYGLGERFDGNLTRAHLQDSSNRFNTYIYAGLTPTPISLPSKLSIEAALNPDTTDYLYFVATGNGGHAFNKTYKAHRKSIQDYLRVLSEQKSE